MNFIKDVGNKEIFVEILHNSIDYLIGNVDEQTTIRMYHKYGFQNPDDFMALTKALAQSFESAISEMGPETDMLSEFTISNPDLQKASVAVLIARKPDILRYLTRRCNSHENDLIESFDWDVRLVMGDSNFPRNFRQVSAVSLNCTDFRGKKKCIHFQINQKMLRHVIEELEHSLVN